MTSWLIPLVVGIMGVLGTLIATKITTKTSHAQLYSERMKEENIRQIEQTKGDFNLYNKKLMEAFNEEDIEKRVKLVSDLRRIRNKINLHFPAFDLDNEYNLLENTIFKADLNNSCFCFLGTFKNSDDKSKNEKTKNEYIKIDYATFLLMNQLENLLETEFRNSNTLDDKNNLNYDNNFIYSTPLYLESLINILFKLQQSLYHIRRLAVQERRDENFRMAEDKIIIKYVNDIGHLLYKDYLQIKNRLKDDTYIENEEISNKGDNSKDEVSNYIFPHDQLRETSVENTVRNTLDKLLENNKSLIIPWKPPNAKRYLVNTSFHHSDGKKFMNPKFYEHKKLNESIYFESHSNKENIEKLLKRYIYAVLDKNK